MSRSSQKSQPQDPGTKQRNPGHPRTRALMFRSSRKSQPQDPGTKQRNPGHPQRAPGPRSKGLALEQLVFLCGQRGFVVYRSLELEGGRIKEKRRKLTLAQPARVSHPRKRQSGPRKEKPH